MLRIINYIIKLSIVVLGLLFLFGIFNLDKLDLNANKMMGIVFILFGLYRLSMLYIKEKREELNSNEDE